MLNQVKQNKRTMSWNLPDREGSKTLLSNLKLKKKNIALTGWIFRLVGNTFHLILQTNLQFNNNKYYLMQLLEDDGAKAYSVWFRWGRGELMRHLLEAEMFVLTQEVNTVGGLFTRCDQTEHILSWCFFSSSGKSRSKQPDSLWWRPVKSQRYLREEVSLCT